LDIGIGIVISFFKPIVWLYIKCFISKKSGRFMAHKGVKGKCCEIHLQGMKFQKIRIFTSVHPHPIGNNLKTSKKWNIQGSWNGTIVLTNKKSQRLYVSNAIITKLWLATTNKAWRFYMHSKPWKERMKDNSKPLQYILSPNLKIATT